MDGANGLFCVTCRRGRRIRAVAVLVAVLLASLDSKQTLPGSATAVAVTLGLARSARTVKVAVTVLPGIRKKPGPPRQATSNGRPTMRMAASCPQVSGAPEVALTRSTSPGSLSVRLTQLHGVLPALRAVTA
jgi:hypothetical protein